MIKLLINDSSKGNILEETSFGGHPVKEIGQPFDWPKCKTCAAEMQYLGKIKTGLGLELIFMCNNDPGMCDEWDPEEGGNKVIIVKGDRLEFQTPSDNELSLRGTAYGVKLVEVDADDYEDARENWKGNQRDVLGF